MLEAEKPRRGGSSTLWDVKRTPPSLFKLNQEASPVHSSVLNQEENSSTILGSAWSECQRLKPFTPSPFFLEELTYKKVEAQNAQT